MDDGTKREFKDRLYEQFERAAQALSSARRLELLDLLAQGEWSVEGVGRRNGYVDGEHLPAPPDPPGGASRRSAARRVLSLLPAR